jgi:hypothetical protein
MMSGNKRILAYAILSRMSGDKDSFDPEDNPKSTARIKS